MAVMKIFWENPYLTELKAKVTSVEKDTITLDQTIAFAFSGGQQSDSGTIGGFEIIEAKKEGKEIFYTLEESHNLKLNQIVDIRLDWEKRYRLMRLHFAAELILEIIYQKYNHPEKIGANITVEKARVDFFWEGNISSVLPQVKEKKKELRDFNLDIKSAFEDLMMEKRYWEIEGFAKVSCGGTHLSKTGEIGSILLKRKNIGNNKERIEIYLDS